MAIIYYISFIILGEINYLSYWIQQNSYMELPSYVKEKTIHTKLVQYFYILSISFHSHALQIFEGSHHLFFRMTQVNLLLTGND